MDCGSPPLPHSIHIIPNGYYKENKTRYEDFSFIRYECDTNEQQLVGDSILRCLSGRWVGTAPKCANQITSSAKQMVTYDRINKKKVSSNSIKSRFLGQQHKECYTPTYEWNMTSSQKILFEVESTSPIDYFSLIVFGKDLVKMWSNQDLVIRAKIERPRKHCVIDKFESMDQISDKTQISFKCFQNSESVSLNDLNPSKSESIKSIALEIESKNTILVKYCSLKAYSFPQFCGSPEKPLHSMNLIEEKSSIVFSCEVDFYLEPIDSHNVKCGPLGDWNRPFPRCVAKTTCHLPALKLSDHFIHVEYRDLNYLNGTPYAETGSVAIYSCRSGDNTDMDLIGDNKRVCHKGFWSGFQPKCSQKTKKSYKLRESSESSKQNNQSNSEQESSSKRDDFNWKKFHLFALSMLISFLIGAAVIGCIAYILIKNLNKRRGRVSKIESPPSLIVSEPNHYYQRNTYEEYRYESLRMNALELLDLERINSLYQTSNN